MSIQAFLARVGPLVEGVAASDKARKIHAVRANDERSWCGRWGISPVTPQRKWDPTQMQGQPPAVYCGQCITVWRAAEARNEEVEDLLLDIEKLFAERDKRAG